MFNPLLSAGEIQSYIKSGAHLTPQGFRWSDDEEVRTRQIECFWYIRRLQSYASFLRFMMQ